MTVGSPNPRISTTPLRPYTRGPELIEFAKSVGVEFLPWQRELARRALEVRADGSWRFKTVVVLVGRQSGKTTFCKVLALWRMQQDNALVVGAAQSLDISREAWAGAVELALDNPDARQVTNVRRANGEQCLTLVNRARYRITASTGKAGRGLSVDLLILDELREHRDFSAWAALSKTTMARPNALTVCISNAGDDGSVVLNQLRDNALARIQAAQDGQEELDDGLALFEWSAPEGCELTDPEAWAQAMPGLGHGTITEAAVRAALATDSAAVFRTELLCMRVPSLDSAVDPAAWKACSDRGGSLEGVRARIAMCLDVRPDYQHVTLMAAAKLPEDGRVRLQLAGVWSGPEALEQARAELPEIMASLRPAEFGWFPGGPSAALGPDLRSVRLRFRRTVPKFEKDRDSGVTRLQLDNEEEFARLSTGLEKEACQTFAADVAGMRVLHPDDALLNTHVYAATKLFSGDGWRFGRPVNSPGQHVDAAYAAAGALYLARLVPDDIPTGRSAVY